MSNASWSMICIYTACFLIPSLCSFVGGIKSFEKKYGHNTAYSLNDALWTCQNMFANRSEFI